MLVSGVTAPDDAFTEAYVVVALAGFAYAKITLPLVVSATMRNGVPESFTLSVTFHVLSFKSKRSWS